MFSVLNIFLGCSTAPIKIGEKDFSEPEDTGPPECQPGGSFSLQPNEVYEDWEVSTEELLEIISQYNTCVWESDGSVTEMEIQIASNEISGWEDTANWDESVCYSYMWFWIEISFPSQDFERYFDMVLKERSLNSRPITYLEGNLPPSNPPNGNTVFDIDFSVYGLLDKGIIENIYFRVNDIGVDHDQSIFVDAANCYMEE